MRNLRSPQVMIPLLSVTLLALASVPCQARDVSPSHPIRGMTTRHGDLTRRIQSYLIKQNAIPKSRSLGQKRRAPSKTSSQGSILTLQKPTKLNLCRWFGVAEDPGNLRGMLQRQFNHEAVGMTNPCVKLSPEEESTTSAAAVGKVKEVSVKSLAVGEEGDAARWWPSMSFAPANPKKWRVLRYRRKVGSGLDCYQRVRDAAFDWEFKNGEDMGLLAVPSAQSAADSMNTVGRGRYTVAPSNEEPAEASAPMHQCIGAARRFVSFSARRIAPFFPKVYSVNPVMIVYDVQDQRGPATTFSSTAYATMKGHLLRGEERVTVTLRDGTEDVEVEILSVSREGPSAKGWMVWPFIGQMQSTFFESQMEYLQNVGRKHSAPR
mmetsp:Transcript_32756/g.93942  ORF Transcript_32756/g.93942 Transcript_32756/m.93942 type:complete len:378 (-) Transcript_32756:389-1522(-)